MDPSMTKVMNILNKSLKEDKGLKIYTCDEVASEHAAFGMPTAMPYLDLCIERSGIAAGKLYELFGFERSGKTTFCLQTAKRIQDLGGGILWVDAEHAWDSGGEDRAIELGVDISNVILARPDTIEAMFRVQEKVIESIGAASYSSPFLIIVDSITSVPTEYELKKEMEGEDRTGHEAKVLKRGYRRLMGMLSKSQIPALHINHAIASPQAFAAANSGGGHAVKFFASVRIELKHMKELYKGTEAKKRRTGQDIKFKVHKNKLGKLRITEFTAQLLNDGGFDINMNLHDALAKVGVVKSVNSDCSILYPDSEMKRDFYTDDWDTVMEENGGFEEMYKVFTAAAVEKGMINPWEG